MQDGNLYITPTLTSDWLGKDRVEGGELKVEDWPCTEVCCLSFKFFQYSLSPPKKN